MPTDTDTFLRPRVVRTKFIFVRVTKDEHAAIAAAAADSAGSIADFVRAAARAAVLAVEKRSKRGGPSAKRPPNERSGK